MTTFLGMGTPGTILNDLGRPIPNIMRAEGDHLTALNVTGWRSTKYPRMDLYTTNDKFVKSKYNRHLRLRITHGGTGLAEHLYPLVNDPHFKQALRAEVNRRFILTDTLVSVGSMDGGTTVACEAANLPSEVAHGLQSHTLVNLTVLPLEPSGGLDDRAYKNLEFLNEHYGSSCFMADGIGVVNIMAQMIKHDPSNLERIEKVDDSLVHTAALLAGPSAEGVDTMNFADNGVPFWGLADLGDLNPDPTLIGSHVDQVLEKIEAHEEKTLRNVYLRDPNVLDNFSLRERKLLILVGEPKRAKLLQTIEAHITKFLNPPSVVPKAVPWAHPGARLQILFNLTPELTKTRPWSEMNASTLALIQHRANTVQNPTNNHSAPVEQQQTVEQVHT